MKLTAVVLAWGTKPLFEGLPSEAEVLVVCATGEGRNRVRHVSSNGCQARRANLGISLASGEWIAFLATTDDLTLDRLAMLRRACEDAGDACGVSVMDAGQELWLVRRAAFGYGALDEALIDVSTALAHWATSIFPAHPYRRVGCEGIRRSAVPAGQSHETPTERRGSRSSTMASQPYVAKRFWEEQTEGYVKWEVFQPDEPEILDLVRQTKPRSVLELGSGAGRNARYFSNADLYLGLDISMNLLRRSLDRQGTNGVGLVCGTATSIPLQSEAFDLVFADSTIQHVEPPMVGRCIDEIVRVSGRWICLIEFTQEIPEHGRWFDQPHMFSHDYARLLEGRANLVQRRITGLPMQPAVKECFVFEKTR